MASPLPDRPSGGDADDSEATPRWVYAFGILIVVLLVGFAALHLVGGGFPSHNLP